MGRKAFITGITGQDGSYLAEILLEKGYDVFGMVRRSSMLNRSRIDHLRGDINLVYGDLGDASVLSQLVREVRPDEVYNLGAQSHVGISFEMPEYTVDVVGAGTLRLLEAIRDADLDCRFYQASSSEMFGAASEVPQRESTPFQPRSPYAISKLLAYWTVRSYREAYGMYAVNGILFSHESPRRGENFVTRKISLGVAAIARGEATELHLGNLNAQRDWGFARDYMDGVWSMLQQARPDDYVLATGETHSVQEFVEEAFSHAGLDWRNHVRVDPRYMRPAEVDPLVGDASKARTQLGWEPRVQFSELVRMMVDADLAHFDASRLR